MLGVRYQTVAVDLQQVMFVARYRALAIDVQQVILGARYDMYSSRCAAPVC
jgi:hypothetical protein